MDNALTQQIRDLLTKNERVGIVVGKNPTIDEMGAALALYLVLQQAGKQISIASPTQPIVEISSLVGIDKVSTELVGEGGDLIVSFPYNEGEIEKVSYTIDNGYLNIVVKAGPDGLTFEERDISYKRGGGTYPELIFVVGTPRLSDLGPIFNPDAMKNSQVVNIDNKSDNQGFGDVVVVSPKYSSVCEQMAQLFMALRYDMDTDIAQNLLSGISYATENFQKPTTSPFAFEITALLLKKGALRQNAARSRTKLEEPLGKLDQEALYGPTPVTQSRNDTNEAVVTQKREQRQEQQKTDNEGKDTNPPDWLMPKVYKGPTTI